MGAPRTDVISWGPERARAGPWRGNRDVAYLAPVPDAPVPSAAFVQRCLDQLARSGYHRVVTGALSPAESGGFLAAGFEISERLHLLAHDLRHLPDIPPGVPMRRAGQGDEEAVLTVDNRAFPSFWRLDRAGLADAIHATPQARWRVAGDRAVIGYAITGRAGRRGYLQRLAVDPDRAGYGVGAALVLDGLRWLKRWRVDRAVVNTQLDNERALRLYERLGFRRQPLGLSVLSAGIP
ncbi:MAG TPA: GNAT family N-acetyltransferase [Acidimicrobiales bacterium]|nr:GNAT family N-acetyltransferase [Acidimicrobiales bacterium]